MSGGSRTTDTGAPPTAEVPELLARASAVVERMLESLRAGRQLLRRRTVERLHHANAGLHEISSATESAATEILDGLDRAFELIDGLDSEEAGPRGAEIGRRLRDELHGVVNHLQFQDITSQQLDHASTILADMERHLATFSALFDHRAISAAGGTEPCPFDPCAGTRDAELRQALVDELLLAAER